MAVDKINIGSFDTVITLFSPIKKKTSEGAASLSWKQEKKVYALVEESVTDEQVDESMNLVASLAIKATIYQVQALNSRWRILYKEENYEITSVSPVRGTPFCLIKAYKIME